jgi:hypothetical protein
MRKKAVIKSTDLKKIHAKLKRFEADNGSLRIAGMSLSHFLIAKVSFDDQDDEPEIRTKRIILHIIGDYSSKPEDLPDNTNLVDNLLYGDDEYSLLQIRLNLLIKEYDPTSGVSDQDVISCETVGECTTLVDSKI